MKGTVIPTLFGTCATLLGASASVTMVAEAAIGEGQAWTIIVALAGTVGVTLRWMMKRQDSILESQEAREQLREAREEKRAEQAEAQTRAMQDCALELRLLSKQQLEQAAAIADIPDRVVDRLEQRKIP